MIPLPSAIGFPLLVFLVVGCGSSSKPTADDMVRVTGGALDVAGKRETVRDFFLDRHEVTLWRYRACFGAGRCTLPIASSQQCNVKHVDREEHPVNCVTHADAQNYCAFVGKRLPTEAEWEWAARGGVAARRFVWGSSTALPALCFARPDEGTCPVLAHPAGTTPEGIAGLAGNVWEWTSSEHSANDKGLVFKGGGFRDKKPKALEVAHRARFSGNGRSDAVGFRCARSAE